MNETVASLQLVAKTNKNARPRQEQKQVFFIKKKQSADTSFEILQGRRN